MFDLTALVKAAGYLGIAAIVFTESGLLVGIIFPGDSLIFTAGFLASQGYLNILILAPLVFLSAVLGDNVGYWLGDKFGRQIFARRGSLFLDPSHVQKAEDYFRKYGAKTILLARFVPVVRTVVPVLAGIGSMHWKTFFRWNIFGGLIWGAGISLAGYFLGASIPNVDRYIIPIIAGVIVVSFLPAVWHVLSDKEYRQRLWRIITK